MLRHQYGTIPWGEPGSYLVADWLHWTLFHHGGGTHCLHRNRYIFWIWICISCLQSFCQHHHVHSQNAWFITMVSHLTLLPTKKFSLAWRKCGHGLVPMEFFGLIICLITKKKTDLIECWHFLPKARLWHQNLQVWGTVLQNLVYTLNQGPIYHIISLVARMYGSRIPEVRWDWPLPLKKYLLPIPTSWTQCSGLIGSNAWERNASTREHVRILMFWKLTLSSSHFVFFMLFN